MKITKEYIPNLLLSIFLVFSLIATTAVSIAKYYILNEKTLIENFEENNISQMTYEEIEKYFNTSEDYSGIPASVYMSAITKDDIKQMIEANIINTFSSITAGTENREQVNFDFTALENNITDYFDKFAQEHNVEVDDKYKAQLQKTIDTAKSEIEDYTDVYMLNFISKTSIFDKAASIYKYLDIIMYICIGLTTVCIIIIAAISKRKLRFALYWYSMSILCSSAIMLIPTLYIKFSGIIEKLVIRNKCIYYAMTGYMSNIINKMMYIEIVMIVIALILLALYIFISKAKKDNN